MSDYEQALIVVISLNCHKLLNTPIMIQNVLSLQESNQDGTRVSEARKVEKQI